MHAKRNHDNSTDAGPPVPVRPEQPPPGPPKHSVQVYRLSLLFALAVGLVLFLKFSAAMELLFLGFLATAAIASLLLPVARRLPLGRWWGSLLAGLGFLLAGLGVLTLLGWLLIEPMRQQFGQMPALRQTVNDALGSLSEAIGLEPAITVGAILGRLGRFFAAGGTASEVVSRTTDVAVNVIIVLAMLFIGSIYLLGESRRKLLDPALGLAPPAYRDALRGIVQDLEPRLRWWLLGTLASSVVIGVASWIGYSIVGLPFTGPLALLAGMAEIVPTIGPTFTLVVALLLASTQGTTAIIGVIIVYVVIQILEGNVVIPLVMRRAVHIPPIVSLFSIVLWGKLFGIPGLLLAIPIDMALWTLADHLVIRRHPPVKPHGVEKPPEPLETPPVDEQPESPDEASPPDEQSP